MNEQLIYEEGKIRITSNVFSNGRGEQFVIPSIKDISEFHRSRPTGRLIFGMILLALAAWGGLFTDSRYYFLGAGVVFVGSYLLTREKHAIRLYTQAGEVEAFVTRDETQFKNVMTCLKRAWALHKG